MKKYWLYPILLMPLLSNCSPVERTNLEGITLSSITNSQRKVSYRLEDLCKSSNNRKDIILNLYIAKSPETDFYEKNKGKIAKKISSFFESKNITCIIKFSDSELPGYKKHNEFGIEILPNGKSLGKRFIRIIPQETKEQEQQEMEALAGCSGYSILPKQICLFNASWEEEKYGLDYNSSKLKSNSRIIADTGIFTHEVLHQMGLPHPETFKHEIFESIKGGVPNIMGENIELITPSKEHPLGADINDLQKKLIHNYLGKGDNYKALQYSGRSLRVYIENVALHNGFILADE